MLNVHLINQILSYSYIFNEFFKYFPLLFWIYLVREFDIGTAPFRGLTMAGGGHHKEINVLKPLRPRH
jgi:hypothetical protein